MDDRLGVQVTEREGNGFRSAGWQKGAALSVVVVGGHSLHALSCLSGYVDQLDHLKLGFDDVQVVVEAGAFTPLGDDGQLRLGGVAHEEQDVHMPGFPVANAHITKLHK